MRTRRIYVSLTADTSFAIAGFTRARLAALTLANWRLIRHFGCLDGDA